MGELAQRLGCHPKTVSKWLHRFNADGLDGLADRPRPGLPRRISEHERGRIIALARTEPPGRLPRAARAAGPDQPEAPAHWTLDALARAAQAEGIRVGRSQVRRILISERVRWRRTRSWATSTDPEFVPKGAGHRLLHRPASGDVGDLCRRARPGDPRQLPARPWLDPDGHRVKAVLDDSRGPEKTRGYGALRVADGQAITLTAPSPNSIGDQQLLAAVETTSPAGTIVVITDNLSSQRQHPHVAPGSSPHPAHLHPKGACWLNFQEGWWRLVRRQALAGQCFATPEEITLAPKVATRRLNARARPWVWGRPPPSPRHRRHAFTYRI